VRGRDAEAALRVPFRDAVLGTKAQVELPTLTGESDRLSITIPAGVMDGQRLRLAGKGLPGRDGGPPGDLLVRIDVEPHAVFTREGSDLHLTVPVTIAEALVGASVEVPTLTSSLRVKVPPKTANGAKLRLRGKGVAPARGAAGDLIVTLEVVMPTGGDDAERAAVAEKLASMYEGDVRDALRQEAGR
jgi:molecular chaperone DnaJ